MQYSMHVYWVECSAMDMGLIHPVDTSHQRWVLMRAFQLGKCIRSISFHVTSLELDATRTRGQALLE